MEKRDYLLIIGLTLFIIVFILGSSTLIVGIKGFDKDNKYEISKDIIEKKTLESDMKLEVKNKVKVYVRDKDQVVELEDEEYLCSVVAGEMPAEFSEEALKAQAVAARTYLMNKKVRKCNEAKGGDICNSTHCQVYVSKDKCIADWGEKGEEYWNKIKRAVYDTKGKVISYNNKIIEYPQFFAVSSGKTENCKDVFSGEEPYLVSVDSKGEDIAPTYTSEIIKTINEFINIINENYKGANLEAKNIGSALEIVERTDAGGVKSIKVGDREIKGTDFRKLIGLNSTNFKYEIDGDNITFKCVGYGHGVGMSQWGANVMAKEGKNYEDILKHYYKGVEIKNIIYD